VSAKAVQAAAGAQGLRYLGLSGFFRSALPVRRERAKCEAVDFLDGQLVVMDYFFALHWRGQIYESKMVRNGKELDFLIAH
jgi:hypothetical protein